MSKYTTLKDHFLIAMPTLDDPDFTHSVTYICEHSEEGAMGLVINQPLQLSLDDIFTNMGISLSTKYQASQPIYAGGPVQKDRGFVLHRPTRKKWQSSLPLSEDLSITTSRDILEAMAKNKGPKDALITLGYAGWQAGQLESELADNSWLCCPANLSILFDIPVNDRWAAANALLGFDASQMALEAGHA